MPRYQSIRLAELTSKFKNASHVVMCQHWKKELELNAMADVPFDRFLELQMMAILRVAELVKTTRKEISVRFNTLRHLQVAKNDWFESLKSQEFARFLIDVTYDDFKHTKDMVGERAAYIHRLGKASKKQAMGEELTPVQNDIAQQMSEFYEDREELDIVTTRSSQGHAMYASIQLEDLRGKNIQLALSDQYRDSVQNVGTMIGQTIDCVTIALATEQLIRDRLMPDEESYSEWRSRFSKTMHNDPQPVDVLLDRVDLLERAYVERVKGLQLQMG